ncbi:hypothetical protein LTS18_010634 [Coniosporium uncinatum]|uniref:Uncharacterized protein n=1 Tax=Coniosporium uncinatum TaxID=93489 RepID=A0ACC3DZU7_9PEZI|nr:hypothetical protein LTS18_010634 [Coniosporium uncinatum]
MNGLGGVLKGGWHPEKAGGKKEGGIRSEFKGVNTVAGWMGKGKSSSNNTDYQAGLDHQSAPLATLKDPDSFGPPPKHAGAHGPAAGSLTSSTSSGGLGAPLPREQVQSYQARQQAQQEEIEKPKSPPVPYRKDTTGLNTANLPKPPARRNTPSVPASSASSGTAQKPKPSLPPRLPPRSSTPQSPAEPPPPYMSTDSLQQHQPAGTENGYINQGTMNRLGQAGINVPGFGIGSEKSPATAPRPKPQPPAATGPQLSELQQRFARMNTGSSSSSAEQLGQRSPLSPANVGAFAQGFGAAVKKAPPPPPKKKELSDGSSEPPPIPLSSKPRPT